MRVKRRNDPDVRAFWTRHVALWMRSPFSQREYCECNGISRSLMSKWWIWLREDRAREERIKIGRYRGRSRRSTMTNETSHRTNEGTNLSPAALVKNKADRPVVRRRRFTQDEKRHFLDLANQPGASISDVAQRYDLALSLLFRWRKELGEGAQPFAGFGPYLSLKLVAECGDDLSAWPSAKHFTSWLGLAPNNKISGGKVLSARTKRSGSRAAALLRLAAVTVGRTDTALGAFYRRLSARIGKAKAVTATARKIAVLFYNAVHHGMEYIDPGASFYESRYRKRVVDNLHRRAKAFGFVLQPLEPGPPTPGGAVS